MKNRKFYTGIAYFLLMFSVFLMVAGCRSKKTTLQHSQSEKENVSVIDKSQEQKTENVQETAVNSSREVFNEKAFSEMWMSFESDKITVTAPDGTKTEITNPRYNKSASQNKDIHSDKQSVSNNKKVSETAQNKQSDIKADVDKEFKSELKTTDERKTKVHWAYFFGAAAVVLISWILIKTNKK